MKKISGKLITIIIACIILMGIAIYGILFWNNETLNSDPTVFAIDKLASEEVKLSEKSITLKTTCDSKDVDIMWSCSNKNKATVKDGVLSLREEGIVVVSAEVVGTNLRDEVVVSIVNDIPTTAMGIEILNKPEGTLRYEDDMFYLSHRLIPEGAQAEEVVYTSSNPKAVTVDEEGKVTVLAPGEADVRVALKSNSEIFDECALDFAWDRYIGDDGTFEGLKGMVSLYSPTVEDEIKHPSYNTYNPIVFKQVVNKDGTSALSVKSSTTGWDTLFIKFDQKVKKDEIYNISYQADWQGEKKPQMYGYALLTGTDKWITKEETNLMNYHTDVEWFDGNVSIPFTANANADCVYLVLVVQDSEICIDMIVDNIRMTSANALILDKAVYNDDGTFEGKQGNISLLSAHVMGQGVEGYGWSNKITFDRINNQSGHAVKVTSDGKHNIDYLYIKVDMPVKKGYKYTVNMDMTGLDEASKKGTYGYWVLSPEANLKQYIQYYTAMSAEDFLKKDAAFTFVSNGDYESFYLLLREYTVEGEDVKFNFTIDNVRVNVDGYIGQDTWLNDDGTFEGTQGNISLYSPTVTSEIAKMDYHAYNSVLFKQEEKEDGTHVLSVESIGAKWDTVFLKFDQQLKRGTTYTITYDAEWKGEKQPTTYNSYGYAIMSNTENWITGNASNLVNYKNDVKWFDGKVEIVFTANADVGQWYLVLVDQNKDIPIQMTIDNVKVTAEKYPVMNSVLNDDGTFEGQAGNFSFYSISELDKTKLNVNCAFQNNVSTFQKVDTDNGTAMAIKTTGTRASMVYVKIKEVLEADKEYEFSYEAKWMGDSLEGINYGYAILPTISNWVTTSNANLEDNILNYTKTPNALDGEFTITFKPNKDYEECYFVLYVQSKEVHVDMLIDNVKLVKKQSSEPEQPSEQVQKSILNDDGTFEGNAGKVSLYNTKHLEGSYNYGKTTADIEFQRVNVNGDTKLSVKTAATSNANIFKMMYIKIDRMVAKGQTYTVSLDMVPQTNTYKNGNFKVTFCSSGKSSTLDSLGARTTVSNPDTFFGENMNLEFTAKENSDCIYMVIWEYGGSKESFEFLIDNIKVTTEYAAEQSILNDDGTFEGRTGNISLYNTKYLEGSYNYNKAVAEIALQKVDVNNNTKLSVKTAATSRVDVFKMMYIKIDSAVTKGQTYEVSMDMVPQTDTYKNGTWKVTFCSSGKSATLDSLGARTTVSDPATFFGENMNLEFTAKENSDCIYMVIWEWGGSKESFEFLMDNIKVKTK